MQMSILEENFAEFIRDYRRQNPSQAVTQIEERKMRCAFTTGFNWGERGVIVNPTKRAAAVAARVSANPLATLQNS